MCGRHAMAAESEDPMAESRESRDANDPRDQLRALNKAERAEFEAEEQGDTGGGEHASPGERARLAAEREAGGPGAPGSAGARKP